MLKLTVALLAVVLAGTASAAGWKSLRLDASSEAAFAQSLTVFKDKLSPARRLVFGDALKDIWLQGTMDSAALQREYTASDYYRQLDGLGYEEVVTFTDPTGATARMRYKVAKQVAYANNAPMGPPTATPSPWQNTPPPRMGYHGQQVRGGDSYRFPMQQ